MIDDALRAENERLAAEIVDYEKRARASALAQARLAAELEKVTRGRDMLALAVRQANETMASLEARATAAEAALATEREKVARLREVVETRRAEWVACDLSGCVSCHERISAVDEILGDFRDTLAETAPADGGADG